MGCEEWGAGGRGNVREPVGVHVDLYTYYVYRCAGPHPRCHPLWHRSINQVPVLWKLSFGLFGPNSEYLARVS